jgi:hypothetical protein
MSVVAVRVQNPPGLESLVEGLSRRLADAGDWERAEKAIYAWAFSRGCVMRGRACRARSGVWLTEPAQTRQLHHNGIPDVGQDAQADRVREVWQIPARQQGAQAGPGRRDVSQVRLPVDAQTDLRAGAREGRGG